jgi:hypothetical protein
LHYGHWFRVQGSYSSHHLTVTKTRELAVGAEARVIRVTGTPDSRLQCSVVLQATGNRWYPRGTWTGSPLLQETEVPRKYQGRREVGGNKIQSGRGSSPTEAQFLANQRREAVERRGELDTVPVSGGMFLMKRWLSLVLSCLVLSCLVLFFFCSALLCSASLFFALLCSAPLSVQTKRRPLPTRPGERGVKVTSRRLAVSRP